MTQQQQVVPTIISYIQALLPDPQRLSTLQQLADGVIFAQILLQVEDLELQPSRINYTPDSIAAQLSNLKLVLRALEGYYLSQLRIDFDKDAFDVMSIVKNKSTQEIMRLFKSIMGVFMHCRNKQQFINTILTLQPHEQSCFAIYIQEILHHHDENQINEPEIAFSKEKQGLLQKLGELQDQNNNLRQQITSIKTERDKAQKQVKELASRIQYLQEEIMQVKTQQLETKMEMMGAFEAEQTNSLIQNLKQKLIQISTEHEREIMKYKEEIELMENKSNMIEDLQNNIDQFAEKIEELNRKNKQLLSEKMKMNEKLEQQELVIDRLQDTIKSQKEEIKNLELEKINLQMESRKINFRSTEFENQVRQKLNNSVSNQNIKNLGKSKLSELCPELESETLKNKCEELQQEILIHVKRNKDLERELSKVKLKAEKAETAETQRKKLQVLVQDLVRSRNEEIEMLTSALYELSSRVLREGSKQPIN